MDLQKLELELAQLPLYGYFFLEPGELEFSQRVRHICRQECPMYGKTWACPPAVGSVESCREKCLGYEHCLMIVTVTEVADIADIEATLATRPDHEAVTDAVRDILMDMGEQPYVLSTEACAICDRCAVLDGLPCRFPERMHPCVESHGINVIPAMERRGLEFQFGGNMVTWISLLFY